MRAILLIVLTLASATAYAYVGPGLGLGVLGVLLGGILAVLLAILGVFWYPIKRIFKKNKKKDPAAGDDTPSERDGQSKKPVD